MIDSHQFCSYWWCLLLGRKVMMAAPIIAGNRLDRMDNETVTILTHPGLLKVNQDPMGMQATRIQTFGQRINFTDVYGDPLARWEQEVWAKPLLYNPGQLYQYGFALALVNHGTVNTTVTARTDVLPGHTQSTCLRTRRQSSTRSSSGAAWIPGTSCWAIRCRGQWRQAASP